MLALPCFSFTDHWISVWLWWGWRCGVTETNAPSHRIRLHLSTSSWTGENSSCSRRDLTITLSWSGNRWQPAGGKHTMRFTTTINALLLPGNCFAISYFETLKTTWGFIHIFVVKTLHFFWKCTQADVWCCRWTSVSHDFLFSLLSGVYFQGTTIGMAPIMSMCTAEQSGGIVMVSDICQSFQMNDHFRMFAF